MNDMGPFSRRLLYAKLLGGSQGSAMHVGARRCWAYHIDRNDCRSVSKCPLNRFRPSMHSDFGLDILRIEMCG